MINIQDNSEQNYTNITCRKCNGLGKFLVFRGDWEDYDEIVCDHASD